MRKGSLVSSENAYEAGHNMGYHHNYTGSDKKDSDRHAHFYLNIFPILSGSWLFARIKHEAFFAYFGVEYVVAFKKFVLFAQVFRAGTIILWTVHDSASTHK